VLQAWRSVLRDRLSGRNSWHPQRRIRRDVAGLVHLRKKDAVPPSDKTLKETKHLNMGLVRGAWGEAFSHQEH